MLKRIVEPSSSILPMLLCCGKVIKFQVDICSIFNNKIEEKCPSSLVTSYMHMWCMHRCTKKFNNCGEVFGASSVFCGPILGKVQTFC